MRGAAAAFVIALTGIAAAPNLARADERSECARAYEQAQRFGHDEQLLKASEAAERCARPSCPALLSSECREWTNQYRARLARLAIEVRSPDGCAARDYAIEIDRVRRPERADVLVDPGVHEVRVVDVASGTSKEETLDVAAASRRALVFDFAAPGATCGESSSGGGAPRSPVPTPAVVLWIGGGALFVTGLVLGGVGLAKRGGLDDCKPACSSNRISGTQTFFTAGDVVGGVGLAAIAAGVLVYVLVKSDVVPKNTGPVGLAPRANGFSVRFF